MRQIGGGSVIAQAPQLETRAQLAFIHGDESIALDRLRICDAVLSSNSIEIVARHPVGEKTAEVIEYVRGHAMLLRTHRCERRQSAVGPEDVESLRAVLQRRIA